MIGIGSPGIDASSVVTVVLDSTRRATSPKQTADAVRCVFAWSASVMPSTKETIDTMTALTANGIVVTPDSDRSIVMPKQTAESVRNVFAWSGLVMPTTKAEIDLMKTVIINGVVVTSDGDRSIVSPKQITVK